MTTTTKRQSSTGLDAPDVREKLDPVSFVTATVNKGRVNIPPTTVVLYGKSHEDKYHDSERGNVTEHHHYAFIRIPDGTMVNGIECTGELSLIQKWGWWEKGPDDGGKRTLRFWPDYSGVSRKGSWGDSLPDGARQTVREWAIAVCEAIPAEMLNKAQAWRLYDLARQAEENTVAKLEAAAASVAEVGRLDAERAKLESEARA
jgi:hypothetical protein